MSSLFLRLSPNKLAFESCVRSALSDGCFQEVIILNETLIFTLTYQVVCVPLFWKHKLMLMPAWPQYHVVLMDRRGQMWQWHSGPSGQLQGLAWVEF